MTVFNIKAYGAAGDGVADDSANIRSAFEAAAAVNGAVYIPAGDYLCRSAIDLAELSSRFSVFGDGPNVSSILAKGCDGIRLAFEQDNGQQPYGVVMRGFGVKAIGDAKRAIAISYGQPEVTNDHYRPAVTLTDMTIESGNAGSFANGVLLEGAWNPRVRNLFISGSAAHAQWNNLAGVGLELRGMCVNAHLADVTCNFWKTGLQAHGSAAGNTEGIFATNCSMVGVQRGVWIKGAPAVGAGRISTLTWTGGMIEGRFKGVKEANGKAAFHIEHVWTALITGAQMISDTIETDGLSYGVVPQDCHGVVVTGCDINAFNRGVLTTGSCRGISVHGNTFTNVANQVHFTQGTSRSRSYGNVCVNNAPAEFDDNIHGNDRNRMGWV
jgi:hypothetical protein